MIPPSPAGGAGAGAHPVTITIDSEHPGPVVPDDFAGLSFERGPLNPGNAGVAGSLFTPGNSSLVTLSRNLGLGSLRIGGGTVDQLIPAGRGSDGFTGIDDLFAFAAAAGVKVIYSLRMLSTPDNPIGDLHALHAQSAGHIWNRYRDNVASFAIGNEPDWHAYHTYPKHAMDPAIFEAAPGVPGVNGTEIGTQPAATTYTPYPWLHENNLAPVAAAGLRFRLTESNDYLVGVPGASDVFASALWALDHLHWWAAHGAAGVNFHNRRGLATATIVPDPAGGGGHVINPKGYGIKAFRLGSAGQVKPVQVRNPDGINLTSYCVGRAGQDYVTVINKAHGASAGDAVVTIVPPSPRLQGVQVMTLAGGQPGDARGATASLGGATITGDTTWDGKWSTLTLPADPRAGISLTVKATTAAIVKIQSAG